MLRQRQHNVQQQNALDERAILKTAAYWRANPLPLALKCCGDEKGVVWEKSIVVKLELDFPGMPELFGLLLSQDERFIAFEIETSPDHRVVRHVESWIDVTHEQSLSLHDPGTGVGHGALALKVLHTLNSEGGTSCDDDCPPNTSLERTRGR